MKKNLISSYKYYLTTTKKPVDIRTYLLITSNYNKFIISNILAGEEVTLPSRMGVLSILGKKQKIKIDDKGNITGLAPDWVKTKKLWNENPEAKEKKQLLYHINSHTDNTRYKFLWSKNKVLVENKTLYSLRMTRANKRAVHSAIKQGKGFKTRN